MTRLTYTRRQAAEALGVSLTTIDRRGSVSNTPKGESFGEIARLLTAKQVPTAHGTALVGVSGTWRPHPFG